MSELHFQALVAAEDDDRIVRRRVLTRSVDSLPAGDVLVRVRYSSLNYKDALSANGNRGVTRRYPHTPGIDAAGVVVAGNDAYLPGDEVICTGYDLGMNTSGGFGQLIRVPADWLVRRPEGLTLLHCMQLGTAGFTAALCVLGLVEHGVTPDKGSILVTGATGGVGIIAIMLLGQLGYKVTAVTGKPDQHTFLYSAGAENILSREEALQGSDRPLLSERWAGVVDTVGGDLLATAVKATCFNGVVTCCGNAASGDLPLTVYPFILRGVHLLGIYSANCPMAKRLRVWHLLATDWQLHGLDRVCRMVRLNQLDAEISAMLAGRTIGRCVVDLGGDR